MRLRLEDSRFACRDEGRIVNGRRLSRLGPVNNPHCDGGFRATTAISLVWPRQQVIINARMKKGTKTPPSPASLGSSRTLPGGFPANLISSMFISSFAITLIGSITLSNYENVASAEYLARQADAEFANKPFRRLRKVRVRKTQAPLDRGYLFVREFLFFFLIKNTFYMYSTYYTGGRGILSAVLVKVSTVSPFYSLSGAQTILPCGKASRCNSVGTRPQKRAERFTSS